MKTFCQKINENNKTTDKLINDFSSSRRFHKVQSKANEENGYH